MYEASEQRELVVETGADDTEPLVEPTGDEAAMPPASTYLIDEATLFHHITELRNAGRELNIASAMRDRGIYARWAHVAVGAANVLAKVMERQDPASPYLSKLREDGYLN